MSKETALAFLNHAKGNPGIAPFIPVNATTPVNPEIFRMASAAGFNFSPSELALALREIYRLPEQELTDLELVQVVGGLAHPVLPDFLMERLKP